MRLTAPLTRRARVAWAWSRRQGIGMRQLALALLVIAAVVVYSTGVVGLPDLEATVERLGQGLGGWTYVLVATLALLESSAFVGLVSPGEVALVVGGLVAAQGAVSVWLLLALAWVATVAGDLIGYGVGRRFGRGLLEAHGPRLRLTSNALSQVDRYAASYGTRTILLGKFIGVVRAFAPFLAGASRMPAGRFLRADAVAAAAWVGLYVLLGYAVLTSLQELTRYSELLLPVVAAVVVATYVVVRFKRRRPAAPRAHVEPQRTVDEPA